MKSFFKLIKEESLIEKNDKILIGFSGGPDSVALGRLLLKLRDEYNLSLGLCHINHLLRGENSDGDEQFVKEFAEEFKIPFYVLRKNVEEYGKINNQGLEEAGRNVRYKYFAEIAEKYGYNKIALAHNLDDNVETFMFRLMRGTGLHGLKGIPIKRENIIRPLLLSFKKDILNYLESINQRYRIDESNNELVYSRNKIRLELIPYIEEKFNPKFKNNIINLIDEISCIEKKEFEENGLKLSDIKKLNKKEREKLIYNELKNYNIEISRNKVEEVENLIFKDGYKEINIGKDYLFVKNYEKMFVKKKELEKVQKDKIQLDIPCKMSYNKYKISLSFTEKIEEKENCFYFDYSLMKEKLFVRTKVEGDKFMPKGMADYKKLKKFFIDEKIDKELRNKIPLIFSGEDLILVGNFRRSNHYIPNKESQKILLLKIEEGI